MAPVKKFIITVLNLRSVVMLEYQNINLKLKKKKFAKVYTSNWSEEVFVVKKVKNTFPWTFVINDHNGEEVIGMF